MSRSAQVLLIVWFVLLYLLFPIDVIPDVIPGLGQLDDLTVIGIGGKKIIDVLKRA